MMVLSSCGTTGNITNGSEQQPVSTTVSQVTNADIAKAKSVLGNNIKSQSGGSLNANDVNWQTAQRVETSYSEAVSVKTNDGESTVVIGIANDQAEQFVGRGTITRSANGNIVITSQNLTSGSKSVTVLAPDGKTVISEERTKANNGKIIAQATCAELREDVADARESAQDAAIEAGLAVAACAAGCVAGGVAGTAVGVAAMGWTSYVAMREDSKYRQLKRTYMANCG